MEQKQPSQQQQPEIPKERQAKVFESTKQRVLAARLLPDMDLYDNLEKLGQIGGIVSGYIITCVGSLKKAAIRPANVDEVLYLDGPFEILSLVGTISPDGIHVHLCISDKEGKCYGGHLKPGCIIYTTGELIIGESMDLKFSRPVDPETTWDELMIEPK